MTNYSITVGQIAAPTPNKMPVLADPATVRRAIFNAHSHKPSTLNRWIHLRLGSLTLAGTLLASA